MKLHHLLQPDLIFYNYDINSLKELYSVISKKISSRFNIEEGKILQAFNEREHLGYSIFSNGTAIPHGRIENLNDLIIAIVKTKNPIEISNQKADLFYCILTSNTGSNRYLKTLAAFARISGEYDNEIRNQSNANEIMDFITELNLDIVSPVKIKDLISEKVILVNIEDPIVSVVDKMKKHNKTFFPVVDADGKYLGQINVLHILKLAYPQYVLLMTDINFLSNLRAFEDFQTQELKTKVKDIYTKSEDKTINMNANIIEFGYILVKKHWHHLTVVDEDNKVVGVVSSRTILQNVLRT